MHAKEIKFANFMEFAKRLQDAGLIPPLTRRFVFDSGDAGDVSMLYIDAFVTRDGANIIIESLLAEQQKETDVP